MTSLQGTYQMRLIRCPLSDETLPLGRSSHSLTVIGRKAYVFGGEHEPRVPIGSAIHQYDFDTATWLECKVSGDVPPIRNAHAAASIGGKIYIFGGRDGIALGEGVRNDLYSFNTEDNVWTKIESKGGDVPEKRSFHAMVSHGHMLYVFGGCGEKGRLNDLHRFNTTEMIWEKMSTCDKIAGRGGAGLVTVNDDIYVVGGFCGKETNDMYRYNTDTNTWSEPPIRNPFPPRSVFGICSIDSKIFLIGGEVDPTDSHAKAGAFSDECYVMDTSSDEGWVLMPPSGDGPQARGWFPAAAMTSGDSKGILIFGGNSSNNERLNDFLMLDIS